MGQLLFKDDQSLFVSARYAMHIIDGWNGQLGDQIAEIQKVTTNTAYGNRSEATIQHQYEQYLDVWNNRIKPALTSEKLYASDTFELRRRLVGIQSEYVAAVTKASKSFVKFSEAVDKNEPKMAELVSETEAIYLKMFDIDLTIIIDSASNKRNRVLQQLPEQPTLYFWGNVLRAEGWTYNTLFTGVIEPQLRQKLTQVLHKVLPLNVLSSTLQQHGKEVLSAKSPFMIKLADKLGSPAGFGGLMAMIIDDFVATNVASQIDKMLVANDASEQLKNIAKVQLVQSIDHAEQRKLKKWLQDNEQLNEALQEMSREVAQ